MRRLVVVTVVVTGALGWATAAGAGSSKVSTQSKDVIKAVKKSITKAPSNPPVSKVSCPDREVTPPATFTCKATVDHQKVEVDVSALDTDPVTFEATPEKVVLSLDRIEGALEGGYYRETGVAVSAECPDPKNRAYVAVDAGDTITCTLTGSDGTVGSATITASASSPGYVVSNLP